MEFFKSCGHPLSSDSVSDQSSPLKTPEPEDTAPLPDLSSTPRIPAPPTLTMRSLSSPPPRIGSDQRRSDLRSGIRLLICMMTTQPPFARLFHDKRGFWKRRLRCRRSSRRFKPKMGGVLRLSRCCRPTVNLKLPHSFAGGMERVSGCSFCCSLAVWRSAVGTGGPIAERSRKLRHRLIRIMIRCRKAPRCLVRQLPDPRLIRRSKAIQRMKKSGHSATEERARSLPKAATSSPPLKARKGNIRPIIVFRMSGQNYQSQA
jgi:hypothetical protein